MSLEEEEPMLSTGVIENPERQTTLIVTPNPIKSSISRTRNDAT